MQWQSYTQGPLHTNPNPCPPPKERDIKKGERGHCEGTNNKVPVKMPQPHIRLSGPPFSPPRLNLDILMDSLSSAYRSLGYERF